MKKSFLYKVIKFCDKTGDYQVKSISGRSRSKRTPRNIKKVITKYTKNPSASVRVNQSNLSKSNVRKNKINQGDKTRTKKCAPNYKEDQLERVKIECKKIYKLSKNNFLVIDFSLILWRINST